jgi:hypothetical protein
MDDEMKRKLLARAGQLRRSRMFPLSLFSSPDYIEAGQIYTDVANCEDDMQRKIEYYNEAIKTYLMGGCEYGRYQAFLAADRMGQLLEDSNLTESAKAYASAARYAKMCDRDTLAALPLKRAAELSRRAGKMEDAVGYTREIVQQYRGVRWKNHHRKAVEDAACICVDAGYFEEAAEWFLRCETNAYTFCAFLCYAIDGKPCDLEIEGPEKAVCDAFGRGPEEATKAIDEYLDYNATVDILGKLLRMAKEGMRPENDIL